MKITLKTVRDNIGLTQEQVSELTGVPVKTIRNWEQEIRKPSDWTMDLVVDRLLRVKLEEYIDKEEDDESNVLSFMTIKNKVCDIAEKHDIEKIVLFGSYVKGNATPLSDVDIYMESDIFGLDYFGLTEEFRESLHKKVGLLSNKTVIEDSKVYKEIMNTGVMIYER
jgi:predicted nucleotidyltransferase